MLSHHRERAGGSGASVVVGDRPARRDEHVADARQHSVVYRAEPAGLDGLGTRCHPRARPLCLEPAIAHDAGLRRVVKSELQASRFTGDVSHAVPQRVVGGENPPAVGRHVEHAVVGGKQNASIVSNLCFQWCEGTIELVEPREPAIRADSVGVACHVQLGNVHIHEPGAAFSQQTHRGADAIVDRLLRVEPSPAQHRFGEPSHSIALCPDDDSLDAHASGLFEDRVVRLPLSRSHRVIPPRQQAHNPVSYRIDRGVAREPVLARQAPRRQGGERCRRRGRKGYGDGRQTRWQCRAQASGVTRSFAQRRCPEPVYENHRGTANRRQGKCRRQALHRRERTGQHVGE